MICVIATIELHPSKQQDFLAEFHRLVPLVRAETGCIEYFPSMDVPTDIPVQGPLRENVIVVLEKWADLPALQQHLQAPHMIEYRTRVKNFVAGVRLQVLRPAEATV